MFISVIVYVRNTEKYLKRCLDSIASQGFDDYEAIIVDDASNDASGRICDEFINSIGDASGKNGKFKVIRMEKSDPSAAKNRGLEEACGDWIWFIDSFDFLAPGALAAIKERMRMAIGEMYSFQYIKVDENGENPEEVIQRTNQEVVRIKNDGDLRWQYSDRLFMFKDSWELWSRLFSGNIIRENEIRFPDYQAVLSHELGFLMDYMMFVSRSVMLMNFLLNVRQCDRTEPEAPGQSSAIPGTVTLLEGVYRKAKRFGKKLLLRDFNIVVLYAFRNQIEQKLDELSDDEICRQITEAAGNKTIGKIIRKTKKQLISAARAERIRK